MVKRGSEMMVLRLVRASVQIFLLPSSCLFSASSLQQTEDTWAAEKLPAVFCLRFTSCKVSVAISYLTRVTAAIKALITATSDFPKRNSTTEESATEFSPLAWFIHEGEQSNQMRISPKWLVHLCLEVLLLYPFTASWFTLGRCHWLVSGTCVPQGVSLHIHVLCRHMLGFKAFCLHCSPIHEANLCNLNRSYSTLIAQTYPGRGGVAAHSTHGQTHTNTWCSARVSLR